jgi:hypothetical protein
MKNSRPMNGGVERELAFSGENRRAYWRGKRREELGALYFNIHCLKALGIAQISLGRRPSLMAGASNIVARGRRDDQRMLAGNENKLKANERKRAEERMPQEIAAA